MKRGRGKTDESWRIFLVWTSQMGVLSPMFLSFNMYFSFSSCLGSSSTDFHFILIRGRAIILCRGNAGHAPSTLHQTPAKWRQSEIVESRPRLKVCL